MLFELKNISDEGLLTLVHKIEKEGELSLKNDARDYLIRSSGGDARAMLKLLEFSSNLNPKITLEMLKSLRPSALSAGSSESGIHYDLTSALIKSIRGSDADAGIYYLARLIEGGESADFIARRLVILASEDIGNANPQALTLTTSCMTSVSKIGFPEARIILAQAVVYLCASPKSNSSYMAINKAMKAVKDGVMLEIPEALKQQHKGYVYPHDFGGFVKQKHMSENLKFVEFKSIGYESKMKEWMESLKV
jgi:putative ATPase